MAIDRPHITDGSPCWCNPKVFVACPECSDRPHANPDCWQCGGEGVMDPPPWNDMPTIVQHNGGSSITFVRKDGRDIEFR